MKSEPEVFSIEHLAKRVRQRAAWDGVRNYQARNFMRDGMQVGDLAFFYHSSCPVPGIYGVMRIARAACTDPSQFDPDDDHYDPGSVPATPRWSMVGVALVQRWDAPVTLEVLKSMPACREMVILRRGNRLSITPVSALEWRAVMTRADSISGQRTIARPSVKTPTVEK